MAQIPNFDAVGSSLNPGVRGNTGGAASGGRTAVGDSGSFQGHVLQGLDVSAVETAARLRAQWSSALNLLASPVVHGAGQQAQEAQDGASQSHLSALKDDLPAESGPADSIARPGRERSGARPDRAALPLAPRDLKLVARRLPELALARAVQSDQADQAFRSGSGSLAQGVHRQAKPQDEHAGDAGQVLGLNAPIAHAAGWLPPVDGATLQALVDVAGEGPILQRSTTNSDPAQSIQTTRTSGVLRAQAKDDAQEVAEVISRNGPFGSAASSRANGAAVAAKPTDGIGISLPNTTSGGDWTGLSAAFTQGASDRHASTLQKIDLQVSDPRRVDAQGNDGSGPGAKAINPFATPGRSGLDALMFAGKQVNPLPDNSKAPGARGEIAAIPTSSTKYQQTGVAEGVAENSMGQGSASLPRDPAVGADGNAVAARLWRGESEVRRQIPNLTSDASLGLFHKQMPEETVTGIDHPQENEVLPPVISAGSLPDKSMSPHSTRANDRQSDGKPFGDRGPEGMPGVAGAAKTVSQELRVAGKEARLGSSTTLTSSPPDATQSKVDSSSTAVQSGSRAATGVAERGENVAPSLVRRLFPEVGPGQLTERVPSRTHDEPQLSFDEPGVTSGFESDVMPGFKPVTKPGTNPDFTPGNKPGIQPRAIQTGESKVDANEALSKLPALPANRWMNSGRIASIDGSVASDPSVASLGKPSPEPFGSTKTLAADLSAGMVAGGVTDSPALQTNRAGQTSDGHQSLAGQTAGNELQVHTVPGGRPESAGEIALSAENTRTKQSAETTLIGAAKSVTRSIAFRRGVETTSIGSEINGSKTVAESDAGLGVPRSGLASIPFSAHLGESGLPAMTRSAVALASDGERGSDPFRAMDMANPVKPMSLAEHAIPADLRDGGSPNNTAVNGIGLNGTGHGTSTRGLEVGFQDPALGYIELRVHANGGGVHAAIEAQSPASGALLAGHLSSLAGWMHDRETPVESLTVTTHRSSGEMRLDLGTGADRESKSDSGGSGQSGRDQADDPRNALLSPVPGAAPMWGGPAQTGSFGVTGTDQPRETAQGWTGNRISLMA